MKILICLLHKELLLEWRQKYALNGILLYTSSTIFICYSVFILNGGGISPLAWNALFWIVVLFSAINTIAKSFLQENPSRNYYYYMITNPIALIVSKIIYGSFLMVIVSFLALGLYSLLLGNPVEDHAIFALNLILGSIGFASSLTMISSIASKAGSNTMLMAILSFPVLIPMILLVLRVSKNALDGLPPSTSLEEILTLIALNVIVIALALLLFPYIWRN